MAGLDWQKAGPVRREQASHPTRGSTKMQLPLQITFRQLRQSAALETAIRENVAKLEAVGSNITSCRVIVEERSRHQANGREFNVRIDLRMPGRELVINRAHDEDAY